MPRTNDGNELLERITRVEKFYLKRSAGITPHPPTTAPGALAQLADEIPTASAANFLAGDGGFLFGTGGAELFVVDAKATNTLELVQPLAFAHDAGARVHPATIVNLGHLDENGITETGSMQLTPVNAATSRVAIAYLSNGGTLGGSFNLRGMNNENRQTVYGVPEQTLGAGTAASPYVAGVTDRNIGTESILGFRGYGVLTDGRNFQVDFAGVRPGVNANVQLGGGTPAVLGVQFNCTSIISRIWN